jgi:hypothetical protein
LLRRSQLGHYETLLAELAQEDPASFKNYTRVDVDLFKELADLLTPRLAKKTTSFRQPIPAACRLAITLRYLATGAQMSNCTVFLFIYSNYFVFPGDSYHSLEYNFRVSRNTISGIVVETCQAIIDQFEDEYMKCPSTPEEWEVVARGFSTRWQFENCTGALDGKHVTITAPRKSGSIFYDYKGRFSIVLLGLVDADYNFLYVDVGSEGRYEID